MKIPISKIIISGDNPRQSFDEEGIRRLGESIKTHGQIQPVVCRPKGDDYELVIGERRLRACALIGLETINAEIRDIDDISANELRLIENVHREDLTDAEKGDAILQLLSFDKFETIKEVCSSIQIPYDTVKANWLPKSRKLSTKVKEVLNSIPYFTEGHAQVIMKYSHTIQNRLTKVILDRKIPTTVIRNFVKLYDLDPKRDLDDIANEVLGIKTVTISEADLTDEQKDKIKKDKETKKSKQKELLPNELRCIAITGKSTRCKNTRILDKEYCSTHDPEKEKKPKVEKPFRFEKVTERAPAHVSYANGENEWYTPKMYIDAARKLMKTIDVDPASSDIANHIIKATTYYTIENDGLKQEWGGNVWMNPPYSQPLVTQFCDLLVEKYVTGEINQACVLVNNATETEFYQNMMKHCKAICFIKTRIKFIDIEGNSTGAPLQGQTILYFGDKLTDFTNIFSEFGVILHA